MIDVYELPTKRRSTLKRGKKASKKKAKPKVRRLSLTTLKKRLEAIRKAEMIALYGNDCFTCPQKNLSGLNLQFGHVPWPRSILAVQLRFDLRFVRPQCFQCNINHGGMGARALQRMQEENVDTTGMWQENLLLKGKTVPNKWFEGEINRLQEGKNLSLI